MDLRQQPGQPRAGQARVVFGLVVMLIGTLLMLDRLDWWGVRLLNWGDVPLISRQPRRHASSNHG